MEQYIGINKIALERMLEIVDAIRSNSILLADAVPKDEPNIDRWRLIVANEELYREYKNLTNS